MDRAVCDKVVPMHQNQDTCWLNALLMCLFYSQGMRAVMMEAMQDWDDMLDIKGRTNARLRSQLGQVYDTVRDLILRKFHLASRGLEGHPEEVQALTTIDPQNVAGWLNAVDPHAFMYTEQEAGTGGVGEIYVRALLSLFAVTPERDVVYVDCVNNRFYRSRVGLLNSPPSASPSPLEKSSPPKVLVVMYEVDGLRKPTAADKERQIDTVKLIIPQHRVVGGAPRAPSQRAVRTAAARAVAPPPPKARSTRSTGVRGTNNKLMYVLQDGTEYIVDSMYFGSTSTDHDIRKQLGHAIAGVTCSNDQYIYNGWMRHTVAEDKHKYMAPCELMKFDWWNQNLNFCLDMKNCKTIQIGPRARRCPIGLPQHRFNPGKGSRIHFAVRKDVYEKGYQYDTKLQHMALQGNVPRKGAAFNPATESYVSTARSEYARWKEIRATRKDDSIQSNKSKSPDPVPIPVHMPIRKSPSRPSRPPQQQVEKKKAAAAIRQPGFFASLCGGSTF